MAGSRFVIAEYEAELAYDLTSKALVAMITEWERRMSNRDAETVERLREDFTDGT